MSLLYTIDIRFADPISAIGMNDDYIVVGSLMGRIAMLSIKDEGKVSLLAELSTENISGIVFDEENTCTIAIGDEEIAKYLFDDRSNNHECQRFANYDNEKTHKQSCEITYCLLSSSHLIMVELNQQSEDGNINIMSIPNKVRIKNLMSQNMYEYEVVMTNYSIPFDFDGVRFLWVEFLSDKERNICVFDFESTKKWEYRLYKEFGHISFARLLNDNSIVIVKCLNEIEVRNLDEGFTLKSKYIHDGDEVIAFDVYYDIVSENNVMNNVNEENKIKNIENDLNINNKDKDNEIKLSNLNNNNVNNEDNKVSNLAFSNIPTIISVDIDGNINYIKNTNKVVKLFNMYNVKDIPRDIKDKQFFSMGYPYYVKANQKLITVSTDYGVFIFKNIIV